LPFSCCLSCQPYYSCHLKGDLALSWQSKLKERRNKKLGQIGVRKACLEWLNVLCCSCDDVNIYQMYTKVSPVLLGHYRWQCFYRKPGISVGISLDRLGWSRLDCGQTPARL
jgi:hypothetical protein